MSERTRDDNQVAHPSPDCHRIVRAPTCGTRQTVGVAPPSTVNAIRCTWCPTGPRGTRVERDHPRVAALIPAEPAGLWEGFTMFFGAYYRTANLAAVAAGPNVT